jgi:hypothetical protein
MEGARDKPAVREPPDDDQDGKQIQAEAQSDTEPFDAPTVASTGSAPLADVKEASLDLKKRIDAAKPHHNMPLDSALGDPEDETRNADGRLDLADHDDG